MNTKLDLPNVNPKGHKVVRATISAAKMSSYTILSNCGPLSHKNPKGRGKTKG
jgi:hypothetical protein